MRIEFENIILRDMVESDIEDYVRWFTTETEWSNTDAPWEPIESDEETEQKSWREYYESVKDLPDDIRRWKFEIEWDGRHIGWVSSYPIDENYEWIDEIKDGQTVYRAIGIDICEPDVWGNGIGTNALRAFINYYFENGVNELYTQTWSGNVRMLRCAEKLGFAECNRNVGTREVDGQKYDGLTFKLENLPVKFELATEADARIIIELRKQIWETTYRGIYPDSMIDDFDYAWHMEKELQRIKSHAYRVYRIVLNNRNIGYLSTRKADGIMLQSLYVLQEYQHRGIGRKALGFVKQYCRENGATSFTLHCLPENWSARKFYKKMGGRIIGEDMDNEESWMNSVIYRFEI